MTLRSVFGIAPRASIARPSRSTSCVYDSRAPWISSRSRSSSAATLTVLRRSAALAASLDLHEAAQQPIGFALREARAAG
jgi:hypothetical protein